MSRWCRDKNVSPPLQRLRCTSRLRWSWFVLDSQQTQLTLFIGDSYGSGFCTSASQGLVIETWAHTRRQQQIWFRRMVLTAFQFCLGVTPLIITVCYKLVFCFLRCCSNTTELSVLCLHASLIFFLTRCTVVFKETSESKQIVTFLENIYVSMGNTIVAYHCVHHLS